MHIQIVGPGCGRCQATEANARQAVANLGLQAEVTHCYDIKEFPKLGVHLTPAVLIDGRMVVSGRVPSAEELTSLLKK